MAETTLTDIVAALSSRLRLPAGLDLVTALEKMEADMGLVNGGTLLERANTLARMVGIVPPQQPLQPSQPPQPPSPVVDREMVVRWECWEAG